MRAGLFEPTIRNVLECGLLPAVLALAMFWSAACGAAAQSPPGGTPGPAPATASVPAGEMGGVPAASSAAASTPDSPSSEAVTTAPAGSATHMNLTEARILPVRPGGRVLPVDTLARQLVRRVTGQGTWADADPVATLLSWTWFAPRYYDEPVILVDSAELRRELGLPAEQKHFSYAALTTNPALLKMVDDVRGQREHPGAAIPPKWTPLQQAALATWHRVTVLKAVFDDQVLRIVPAAKDAEGAWVTIADLDRQPDVPSRTRAQIRTEWGRMRAAFAAGDSRALTGASMDLTRILGGLKSPVWPERRTLVFEALYNMIQLFKAGWIVTGLALVIGLLAAVRPNRWIKAAAWGLLLDGLVALTAGILLRWRFAGHLPVTTMYESLVVLAWGVTAIGLLAMVQVRQRAMLPVVAALATAILVIVDVAPLATDVAVLRPDMGNPAQLTGALLAVMLAYSAFALGMGLGHVEAVSLALAPGAGNGRSPSIDSLARCCGWALRCWPLAWSSARFRPVSRRAASWAGACGRPGAWWRCWDTQWSCGDARGGGSVRSAWRSRRSCASCSWSRRGWAWTSRWATSRYSMISRFARTSGWASTVSSRCCLCWGCGPQRARRGSPNRKRLSCSAGTGHHVARCVTSKPDHCAGGESTTICRPR